jgi:hypothetical protein
MKRYRRRYREGHGLGWAVSVGLLLCSCFIYRIVGGFMGVVSKQVGEVMNISVENLAEVQLKVLKQHVLDTLKNVMNCIEHDSYTEVELLTFYSPAGDGDGVDNHCINFGWDKEEKDILQVCGILAHLHKTVKGGHNGKW